MPSTFVRQFSRKSNDLLANPATDLDLPRKEQRRLPKGLSKDVLAHLMNVPDVRDPLGIRDRAMLETLYATGARRSELTNLDLSDLDPSCQTLLIRKGKGDKDRLLPIGKTALHWLQEHLESTRPKLLLEVGAQALFLSGYGERFSPGSFGNWVAKTIKTAGITKPGSCHLLRHSCATHMHENGADIRVIQQLLLGHARLDTTSIYTAVAITRLKKRLPTNPPGGCNRD